MSKTLTNCVIKDKNSKTQFQLGGISKNGILIGGKTGDYVATIYDNYCSIEKLIVHKSHERIPTIQQIFVDSFKDYEIEEV